MNADRTRIASVTLSDSGDQNNNKKRKKRRRKKRKE
jgi:hypothetical protein